MRTRKEMKRQAKKVVKSHYGILFVVCLIAAFLGTEFVGSLDFSKREVKTVQYAESSGGISADEAGTLDIIVDALVGDIDGSKARSQEKAAASIEASLNEGANPVFGRSRGVLAGVVNGIVSGTMVVNVISAIRSIGVSQEGLLIVSILLALGLSIGVWIFLVNMYKAVARRIFLESRTYERVTLQRFAVFLRVKRWTKVSITMFMTAFFSFLWFFTIIGGIIKKYSYYMVPYIVAENPDIHWRDAIKLSRKMMSGHKMECFILEISFIFWYLLGFFTLGLSDLFFTNSYKTATFSEYYAELRRMAKEKNLSGSQLLNDVYLFQKADEGVLREAYSDVIMMEDIPEEAFPLKEFRGLVARVFGITLFHRQDEDRYEMGEERKLKVASMEAIVAGKSYPGRLFPIPESQKNSRVENIHYLRHYSVTSLILMYFIFAFIGWLWEVSLHLITNGEFVNRGVLQGPWLPIYGTGGLLILVLLNVFRKKPVLEFVSAVVLCGCVEYFTAYYLEMTHGGQKWWDYSGYFLNLHGRICAEGLLVFGIGGMAIVYFVAPLLDNHLRRIKRNIAIPLCALLLILFTVDQIYSKDHPNMGKGITDDARLSVELVKNDVVYWSNIGRIDDKMTFKNRRC